MIKEGDVAKITDFSVVDNDGNDITEVVNSEDLIFLVVMYDLNKTSTNKMDLINDFAKKAESEGIEFIGLSAASYELAEEFRHKNQTPFPIYTTDGIVLKTIIRSNPGLVMMRRGTVVGKWHNNDIPTFEDVLDEYNVTQ